MVRRSDLPAKFRALDIPYSTNISLASISRWKIGGPAAMLVEPRSANEVAAVMAVLSGRPEPIFVMGDASNVLFDSMGFDGVVIRIGRAMSSMRIEGTRVQAEAGIWVPQFARRVGRAGLTGAEHTVGIPGTLGGLVLMNGGSQRKGIGLNVKRIRFADEIGQIRWIDQVDCGFAYRRSVLQDLRAVVVEVELSFKRAAPKVVLREMIDILASRRFKFPKNQPNCGSTFLSDPALYATMGAPGRVIEIAGLKGLRRGGAQISPLHANFIVNNGNATSEDVLWLIGHIRARVLASTGYLLNCEVRHVAPDGRVRPAHITAEERWDVSELLGAAAS